MKRLEWGISLLHSNCSLLWSLKWSQNIYMVRERNLSTLQPGHMSVCTAASKQSQKTVPSVRGVDGSEESLLLSHFWTVGALLLSPKNHLGAFAVLSELSVWTRGPDGFSLSSFLHSLRRQVKSGSCPVCGKNVFFCLVTDSFMISNVTQPVLVVWTLWSHSQ